MEAPHSNRNAFVSNINVTPFVDVMLVLLIIFMITAPLMTQGLNVDLPTTQAVDSLPQNNENVTLTVKDDLTVWLDKLQIDTLDNLPAVLEENVKKQNKTLYLQADKKVPYGMVVDIMGRIRLANIDKIGMIAEKVEPPKAITPSTAAPSTHSGQRNSR